MHCAHYNSSYINRKEYYALTGKGTLVSTVNKKSSVQCRVEKESFLPQCASRALASTGHSCSTSQWDRELSTVSVMSLQSKGTGRPPTYTKITNMVSATTFFGLCTCKWGN